MQKPKNTNAEEITGSDAFRRCVEFHGHICPGLAIGFQAARTLMDRLGVHRSPDEELVAIVETDACGADAIQVMTGCTFGKGNFIFKNYGKHAFSLIDRNKRKAFRVCLLPSALRINPKHSSLFERVRGEIATPEEMNRYKQLQQEKIHEILGADPNSLFKIEEIAPDIPPKASIMESELCDLCGEPTKVDLLREVHGQKVCPSCIHRCDLE